MRFGVTDKITPWTDLEWLEAHAYYSCFDIAPCHSRDKNASYPSLLYLCPPQGHLESYCLGLFLCTTHVSRFFETGSLTLNGCFFGRSCGKHFHYSTKTVYTNTERIYHTQYVYSFIFTCIWIKPSGNKK